MHRRRRSALVDSGVSGQVGKLCLEIATRYTIVGLLRGFVTSRGVKHSAEWKMMGVNCKQSALCVDSAQALSAVAFRRRLLGVTLFLIYFSRFYIRYCDTRIHQSYYSEPSQRDKLRCFSITFSRVLFIHFVEIAHVSWPVAIVGNERRKHSSSQIVSQIKCRHANAKLDDLKLKGKMLPCTTRSTVPASNGRCENTGK